MVRAWQTQLAVLAVMWGSSFVLIKIAVEAFSPTQVTAGRILVGAAVLGLLVVVRREALPRWSPIWAHFFVAGLLLNVVPFALIAWGETRVTSVVAGIWNATTPLVVLLVVLVLLPQERPTRERVLGLAVGFAGVALVMGPWRELDPGQLLGNLACFGAAVFYGFGFPYTRRYLSDAPHSPVVLSATQMLCASIAALAILPLGEAPAQAAGWHHVAAVVALGVFGTGLAYVLNFNIIRAAGATAASTVTYLIPLVSTTLGVVLLGEALHWNEPVGGLVVIVGIAISQGAIRRR